jgi:hypothetical protein
MRKSHRDNMLAYEAGVIRFFGKNDIGTNGLLKGWAKPEDMHAWNDGQVAELLLSNETAGDVSLIVIEGQAYVNSQAPFQDITMFANGLFVGFWRLREGDSGKHRIEAEVGADLGVSYAGTGILRLTFLMPLSIRPSELGVGDDHRQLAFCFHSLMVS